MFLFPSREETEEIVVLEALAMKIPILLRNIPVYEDWLAENKEVYKAGNIENFEQKARKIFEEKLPDLTEAGYRVAETRSLENIGIKLGEIYRKITRAGLRQPNAGKIYRKLGCADCRNDFSNTF